MGDCYLKKSNILKKTTKHTEHTKSNKGAKNVGGASRRRSLLNISKI
jgi:hypothetical protein